MKIQSSFSHTVPTATQQAIQNACTNYGGIDAVTLVWVNENTDFAPCYDVFNANGEEEYLFSIDSEGNQTYER
jgi:hypothetical protein